MTDADDQGPSGTSSTDPDAAEQQRVDDLPSGAGVGADGDSDAASGGAPADPES